MARDITLLIAHCDDECLFAWPILDRIKHLVCVSSDLHNSERAWCRERKICLREVCEALNIPQLTCFDYNSEFYRLPTRGGELKAMAQEVVCALKGATVIFTHNSWGEYFNLDHQLCHQIGRASGLPMLVSDIAQEVNWGPVKPYPQGALISRHALDRARFDSLKAIYDARGCWTWSHEPVTECGVYRV